MNLHQFYFVREAVRRSFNLTEAAKALATSQPGVSKAIIELEDELGVDIFRRHGKRVRSLTEPGRAILLSVEKILQEIDNIKRVGKEYAEQDQGKLVLAAAQACTRYTLPSIVTEFKKKFPRVRLSIMPGTPTQVADRVNSEEADLGLITAAVTGYPELNLVPSAPWHYVAVMPSNHPLMANELFTLEELARYPLLIYDTGCTSSYAKLIQTFELQSLTPEIALRATDADTIKTYLELGLGIGIVPNITVDAQLKSGTLRALSLAHLFGSYMSYIVHKQGVYLRRYMTTLIEMLAAQHSEVEPMPNDEYSTNAL
ncbi:Transcriptional regulator, LysR family [Mycoavidus cysteinexigens]|uniref:Transcriptional regulator, LysR family n=1 Tax=Mycoavidus cysteinexigens TaxID=1553431 RepID=A0A2Z6EWN2_9BURK|nr:LysR substrate-binding domain-containing protein [Mycoavidus cysteinexigens]BBE09505.1 Transcriptional regulator, LysR family [Mycoavidus cysteinexigens]GAM51737.1 cys regulon transcriptional activator CysB [bacterium endosymbiont of Mortierella elongata FMR23-6]GLR01327.1 hypothetical protein GCM10007934_11390 [Mycoavidus cysteinexigens]